MPTPLTDAINALTTYANEVTGEGDTTLSDAVHTLASGYGSGVDYMAQNLLNTLLSYTNNDVTSIRSHAFRESNIERVTFQSCTSIGAYSFRESKLKNIYAGDFPSLEYIINLPFIGCAYLECVVLPRVKDIGQDTFRGLANMKIADLGGIDVVPTRIQGSAFRDSPLFTKLILRYNSVIPLMATTVFIGTPFDSGGSGGEIYVPSSLIAAYKSAANWSVFDGYGTITWKAIEGSTYELQYADGTPIT